MPAALVARHGHPVVYLNEKWAVDSFIEQFLDNVRMGEPCSLRLGWLRQLGPLERFATRMLPVCLGALLIPTESAT